MFKRLSSTTHTLALAMSLPILVLGTGCGSSDAAEDEIGDSESDVVTKKCPADLDITFKNFRMMTDEAVMAAGVFDEEEPNPQLSDTLALRDGLQSLGELRSKGTITQRKSGRCTYKLASGGLATLYTKSGKTILSVEETVGNAAGGVRIYAFPKSVATTGLTLGAKASAIVQAEVSSGDAEGPGILLTRVGTARTVEMH